MKELMIHVEKAVRPLRITRGQCGAIREELLTHLTGIYDEEMERLGDHDHAVAVALSRFGPADDVSRQLQAAMPWYSAALAWIPWFARVRAWPESPWRIAWRAWMTGILFWLLVGVPWCLILVVTQRKTAGQAATTWLLMASLGVAMLGPFVAMVGSVHGVFGLRRSLVRATLSALVACALQLGVSLLMRLYVNPALHPLVFAIPFAMSFGMLAMLRTDSIGKLVRRDEQRDARTGEWERLVLDE